MSLTDKRDKIIVYIQKYSREHGKPPTIKSICDNLEGVNRSNFYTIFTDGIGEACKAANIEVPSKRIASTVKAVRSRRSQKTKLPQITLNEETSSKIQVISHIENMTLQEIMDELIENDRILRKEYDLNIRDMSRLASFLKNCEKFGITKARVVNSLIKFTNLRLDVLPKQNFNLLIRLWEDMLSKDWSFNHILWLYSSREDAYQKGYLDCIKRVTPTIVEEVEKRYSFKSFRKIDVVSLGTSVSGLLNIARLDSSLV